MSNKKPQKPSLILAATPAVNIHIPNFFNEGNNELFQILKNPPYLRYSGWNLLTLDNPKIKEGNSWVVSNGGRKDIRLYNNLSLVFRGDATEELLGWGNNNANFQEMPLLNSLAIIETIYEFIEVYKKMLGTEMILPDAITLGVSLSNTTLSNGKKLLLRSSPVTNIWYFVEGGNEIDIDFNHTEEVQLSSSGIYDSRYVAFQLVMVVFTHFGIPTDRIPYTAVDAKGARYIDLKSFMKD